MSDREGSPTAEADVNPDMLNVKVTDGNNEVFFKIKRTTKLGKLMKAFCDRQGKTVNETRFMFEGEKVKEDSTPESLDMEEGDSIEAFSMQIGGGAL